MKIKYIDGPLLRKMIGFAAINLENNKQIVNELNVFPVPDGDTGTNMLLTIQLAAKEVEHLQSEKISKISDAASNGALMGARGNSGVILSQLFRGFAKACKDKDVLEASDLSEALKAGSDMAYKAIMKPTEGTILTVARECAKFAVENAANHPIDVFLEKIIEHGNNTLDKTPDMLPVLKEAGVVDAGGKGLMCILEGFYRAIFEDDIKRQEEKPFEDQSMNIHTKHKGEISTADIKHAYCTEFMIMTQRASIEKLKTFFAKIGDSVLVVGDEEKIKVHVHTNHPGKAIEHALQNGELINIKIDNMKEQHRNELDFDVKTSKNTEEKDFAFITVSSGEGISKVFSELGVDSIIQGGQTMNPSIEDFLIEIENINAKHIYILPNNSNIIMAAKQAKEISDKSIDVLPTKTIPQGITALFAFQPELDQVTNLKNMEIAIGQVKTGQITFAIRDTQVNNIDIKKEDIIGLYDNKILNAGKDLNDVTLELIENMIDKEDELITVFTGKDTSDEQIQSIEEEIKNKFPDTDVEIYQGDQPIYYYIIAVE